MKKYILGTHEGRPITPSVVSFLHKKEFKVIQTKSWSEALTMCQNITFDLIIGLCNYNLGEIDRFLARINANYTKNMKPGAAIILQAHKHIPDAEQFSSIKGHLKEILPSGIDESKLLSIIETVL
jgi:protein-tyrosine-phosphatase